MPLAVLFFFIHRHYKKKYAEAEAAAEKDLEDSNRYTTRRDSKYLDDLEVKTAGNKLGLLVFTVLSVLFLFLSSVWFVPVSNVGIVSSFNAPTGRTTGSGLEVTWPWQEVKDFDASLQTTRHDGGDKAPNCSNVRIGSLATACTENVIQWKVKDTAAPRLYRLYKGNFESLSNNFVSIKIQSALNEVFATYNPLSQVNIQTGQTSFDGAKLAKDVQSALERSIGTDIEVTFVSIPMVHHDVQTENNIKSFQDVVAKSRILDQQNANADKEKSIADKQKVFLTDQYIQNKCVDESVKMGVPPGLCLVGGGAIVNAQATK